MSTQFKSPLFSTNGATNMVKNMAMALPLSELSFVSLQTPHVTDEDFESFMNIQTPGSDNTNADTLSGSSSYAQDDLPSLPEEYMINDFNLDFDFLNTFYDASDTIQLEPRYVQPTLFSSFDEAREAVRRQGPTAEDPTFPKNVEDMCNMVAALKVAMKSTDKAKDSNATIEPFLKGTYKDITIEVACWELLTVLTKRHLNGASFVPTTSKKETGSFSTRFATAIHSLQQSKSICKHLLDPAYANVFVDDPLAALKRVQANRKVNVGKSRVLDAGKKALEEAEAAKAAEESTNPPCSGKKRKGPR